MAQQDTIDVQSQQSAEGPQEMAGYTALPNLLLQALGGENGSTYSGVLFIARHTLGRQIKIGDVFYRVKEVCLSLDEFRQGRRKRDGNRMADTSGLTNDAAIVRGCRAALARGLIQVVDTGARGVHVYTLADRFWKAAGFTTALKMLADPRVPASFTAYKMIAVGDEQALFPVPSSTQTSMLEGEQAPSSAPTAHKIGAVSLQNVSSTAHKMAADISDQPAQEEVRGERKYSNKHRIVNIDRSFDTTALQNETQKEEKHTTAILQPSVSTIPTEYPQAQPHLPATIKFAEVAARYQHLFALQQELALLKKTPSMQLLARQRIPRLEAEIQQLLAALQESA